MTASARGVVSLVVGGLEAGVEPVAAELMSVVVDVSLVCVSDSLVPPPLLQPVSASMTVQITASHPCRVFLAQ